MKLTSFDEVEQRMKPFERKTFGPAHTVEALQVAWVEMRDVVLSLANALRLDMTELFALDGELMGTSANASGICQAWQNASPVVSLVLTFAFFPANWKAPIVAIVATLNAICP